MALYKFFQESSRLHKVEATNFTAEQFKERAHMQNALKQDFSIIDSDVLIISEEYSGFSISQKRIDLLGVDRQGNIVVIELKRDETGSHMELQAIRYASMVAQMTFDEAVDIYANYLKSELGEHEIPLDAREQLERHLSMDEPAEGFGSDVRIQLVSQNFSQELVTSVMWLREKNLDIECYKLTPYKNTDELLIYVQKLIPLPESEEYFERVAHQTRTKRKISFQPGARGRSTKYKYKDKEFAKSRLVLEILHDWCEVHNPNSLETIRETFTTQAIPNLYLKHYREVESEGRQDRFFCKDDELLQTKDHDRIAVSTQWGMDNFEDFLEYVTDKLGFNIEVMVDPERIVEQAKAIAPGDTSVIVTRLKNKSIHVEIDGKSNGELRSTKAALRKLVELLSLQVVITPNLNTRGLGRKVIEAILQQFPDQD